MPSRAEYWHMGGMPMRLFRTMLRSVRGSNRWAMIRILMKECLGKRRSVLGFGGKIGKLSANPADLGLLAWDGRRRSLRVPDDDWRNRHPSGGKAEHILPGRRIEEALRETDPTGAESGSVR